MPSNRKINAAKRNNNKAAANGRRRGAPSVPSAPQKGSASYDIIAVMIMVIAIAMAISIISPGQAPVTVATGEFLELLFGVGALLFPLALFLYAATFFVDKEDVHAGRIIAGLLLVILAILGLLSINYSSASSADPDIVLSAVVAKTRGGYLGGALAWCLLSLVGPLVGNVILLGMTVTGIVICGFSISDTVGHISERMRALQLPEFCQKKAAHNLDYDQDYPQAYPEAFNTEAQAELEAYAQEPQEEPKTSYIGNRKTTVLRRGLTSVLDSSQRNKHDASHKADQVLAEASIVTPLVEKQVTPARTAALQASDIQAAAAHKGSSHRDAPDALQGTIDQLAAQEQSQGEVVPDFLLSAVPTTHIPAKTRRNISPRSQSISASSQSTSASASGIKAKEAKRSPKITAAPKQTQRPGDSQDDYELPPLDMLSSNPHSASSSSSADELNDTMSRLQGTLQEFGLRSRVVDYVSGPLVTTFRVEMGEGERVNKIRNLEDDIALTLAAEKVRIFAPIPGTSFVGIEIPNKRRTNVHLGDVLPYATGGPLEVAIGRDSAGRPVIADIAKMPHMLVAGTTGSGKSVLINSMIMSLLMRTTPKQVRLIMVDPKRVEFGAYNGLPHLYVPVVTEPRQAASALQWAVSEMERRLKVFERAGARDIRVYNKMCTSGKLAEMDNPPEPMPYLVVIIDELSDLMMVAGKDVEASIVRIAQLARAAGIHLVIATQRPSANVVTGLIKSNIDSRVALKVSSGIDSRVILDETGAERLLGHGDMLFKDRGYTPKRVLGCWTSDDEINSVVDFIRDQAEPDYHEEILSQVVPGQPIGSSPKMGDSSQDDDPLVWEAAQIVVDSKLGSTSGLQRRLKVGYARAGRIMDMLEAKGIVGPPDGSKPREVLLDKNGLDELREAEAKYREV